MNGAATRITPPTWHESVWVPMATAIAAGRVAHGLLICGPRGVGKRHFADRVVAALLCRTPRDDGDACGECPACRQRLAGTHPDIARLVPEERGRLIKVEQVRAFSQRLHLTPQYDSGRVGWIEPAEDLSPSAANSLLKTLEEPPASCHIVLVTDRLSALMATVRSRCQIWRVPPPSPRAAEQWLGANDVAVDALDVDSLRAPFRILERRDHDYDALVRGWDDTLADVIRNREDAASASERLAKSPADLFVEWLYRRASAMLAVALAPARGEGEHATLPGGLARVAARMDAATFEPWCVRVADAARLARTNADWQLVVESLLLDIKRSLKRRATAS